MKNRRILIGIIVTVFVSVQFSYAETYNEAGRKAIENFYKEYFKTHINGESFLTLDDRCLKILKKYCTDEYVAKQVKAWTTMGYDYSSDNCLPDSLALKTLRVSIAKDHYVVTFQVDEKPTETSSLITNVCVYVYTRNGKICKVEGIN